MNAEILIEAERLKLNLYRASLNRIINEYQEIFKANLTEYSMWFFKDGKAFHPDTLDRFKLQKS